ncbi:MAG: hypothetical protein ACMG57_00070 [Candidatus Dojkabacteria bacterium]
MKQYINEIIIDNEYITIDEIDASYTVIRRVVNRLNYFAFIITLHSDIKISNYPTIFKIEEAVIKHLRKEIPLTNRQSTSVIAIFEFESKVSFLPDLRNLNTSENIKANIEKEYIVNLVGAIAIFHHNEKINTFKQIFNTLLHGTNLHVAKNLEEAISIWSSFIEGIQ